MVRWVGGNSPTHLWELGIELQLDKKSFYVYLEFNHPFKLFDNTCSFNENFMTKQHEFDHLNQK